MAHHHDVGNAGLEVLVAFDVKAEALVEGRSMDLGAELLLALATLFGGFDVKEQCKLAVTGDAAWEGVADDPRFRPLLDRLAAV